MIDCELCNAPDFARWGVPTFNGDVITTPFAQLLDRIGQFTGSIAVCRECFEAHEQGEPAIEVYDECYRHFVYFIGPFGRDGAGI